MGIKFNDLLWEEKEKLARNSILNDDIVRLDMFNFLCGELIGFGISRWVFEYSLDPKNYVVKIDMSDKNANVIEWTAWDSVKHNKDVAKWFAPCKYLSCCGRILVQKRANKKDIKSYPKEIPAFLWDVKYDNYGFIGNQLVCVDYAIHGLIENGMNSKRMKKANWK